MLKDLSWDMRRKIEKGVWYTLFAGTLGYAGLEASAQGEMLERFMQGVNDGTINFTIRDESGHKLDLSNHKELQAKLNELALDRELLTVEVGMTGRKPICAAPILAINAKDLMSGKLVNELKTDGLQLNLKELNELCARYQTIKPAVSTLQPDNKVVADNHTIIRQVVAPELTPER